MDLFEFSNQLLSLNNEQNLYIKSAITSLAINDIFDGKIMKYETPTISYFYNVIDNNIIDLVCEQNTDYMNGIEISRNSLISDENIKRKYLLLLERLKNNVKFYKLINEEGKIYISSEPGTLGGNKRLKIYGRLDCPSANSWIRKGYYVQDRIFFKDEDTAIKAGYRPCAICMRKEYKEWKKLAKDV